MYTVSGMWKTEFLKVFCYMLMLNFHFFISTQITVPQVRNVFNKLENRFEKFVINEGSHAEVYKIKLLI